MVNPMCVKSYFVSKIEMICKKGKVILFTMLCQFYIINTNNRYNNIHKNIPHTVSDKAGGYMLQPKPITTCLA